MCFYTPNQVSNSLMLYPVIPIGYKSLDDIKVLNGATTTPITDFPIFMFYKLLY